MSLINDALRKARQAAAEHEAQQPDTTFRPPLSYPSRGRQRQNGALGFTVVALVAALLGAGAAWWFLDRSDSASDTGPPQMADERTSADGTVHDLDPPPVAGTVAEETGQDQTLPTNSAPEIQSEASAGGSDPAAAGPRDTGVNQTESAPPRQPALKAAPTRNASGQRVYVLDADLGYAKLSLGYIVARSTNPFAEINGDDLYVGSEVEGFTVIAIEPNSVVLRDDKGELVLQIP